MFSILKKISVFLLTVPVYIYRFTISPFLKPSCRHVPTCSQYALDALRLHGPVRGMLLSIDRILRCRPGGTHGYDPVPLFHFRKYKPFRTFIAQRKKGNRLKRQ